MKKCMAGLLVALATAFLAQSCATRPLTPLRNGSVVKQSDYGSPNDSVIVYGEAADSKGFLGMSGYLTNIEMIQLNPSLKPAIITPADYHICFFTEPLPVGSSVRFLVYSIDRGRVTTVYERGLQGHSPTDCKLTKPGLLYLGSLVYCNKEYIEKTTGAKIESGYDYADLYPVGEEHELRCLQTMLHVYKGTSWEQVITARIKELQK